MRNWLRSAVIVSATAVALGQAQYKAPRTAHGEPDFNGVWQALNTANWNIQDHAAGPGPVAALGAAFSIPGGQGVVTGGP